MVAAIITLTKFDTRNIAIPIAELRDHRHSGIRIASRRLHRELAFQPHIRFPHPTRHGRPALPVASTRNFGRPPSYGSQPFHTELREFRRPPEGQ